MEQPYETNQTRPFEDDLEKGIEREECPICLDNTEATCKTWVQLKVCSHAFHKSCIDLWLSKNANPPCPLCLRDIRQKEINNRSIVMNNEIVVLPERPLILQRELEQKCVCFITCLCCIAVFIVPPMMIFAAKN